MAIWVKGSGGVSIPSGGEWLWILLAVLVLFGAGADNTYLDWRHGTPPDSFSALHGAAKLWD